MGVKLLSTSGGSVEVVAPATASSFTATMPAGTGTVAVNGVSGVLVSGTAVASTSGTSIDFTSIPSWVKRITVMLKGVSLSGTSTMRFQLGDSGGIETTGYVGTCTQIGSAVSTADSTSGFDSTNDNSPTQARSGQLIFSSLGSNTWTVTGGYNIASSFQYLFSGAKTLTDTLDRVRITTVNGTDTFDAGSINILYE